MTGGAEPLSWLADGLAARPDAVAEVRVEEGDPRSGPGGRAYRVTMAGGVSVEVLPERGLDLGSLWWNNQPVAWRSALGPRGGALDPAGEGWIGRFGGGALVTCGLDNIGPARDGRGLHGSHHLTPAEDVAITRTPEGDVEVSGVVDSSRVFGRRVTLRRRIRIALGRPEVVVEDVIVNEGPAPADIAVLYHVNFGVPVVVPGSTVSLAALGRTPRDAAAEAVPWEVFPDPVDHTTESVWEHTGLAVDGDGRARAVVRTPSAPGGVTGEATLGTPLEATVSWRAEDLPRCMQWIYPTRGGWALGIEPTNAPLFGPDRSGPHAGAPVLEPGETRTAGVTLTLG
jgi:hypothetical protein